MEYVNFGRTGIRVSQLCFGTMTFGAQADRQMSERLYKRAREAGINFFDCANIYAGGESERILGKLIAAEREKLIVTSKVCGKAGEDLNDRGASRRHIRRAVDDSLRRLGTDYLDIYFLHQFDVQTPLEETFSALDDLVHSGKVHYIGVSNFAAWQVEKALGVCRQHGWQPIHCLQPMYNLVKRQAAVELLPMAAAEKLGVITYSPLGGGLLTGKYGADHQPERGRLVESERYRQRYGEGWMHDSARRFTELARQRGLHPVSLAVAWVARHAAVTAPIIGARNLEQLEPALAAAGLSLDDELYAAVSALSPTPPPATDRTEKM